MRHQTRHGAARQRLGVPFCLRMQNRRAHASVLRTLAQCERAKNGVIAHAIGPDRVRVGTVRPWPWASRCQVSPTRRDSRGPSIDFSSIDSAQSTSTSTRLTLWQKYCLAAPKDLLRLRSLVARGRARKKVRTRSKTPREIELLFARSFPNELFWRVMAFWNPRR